MTGVADEPTTVTGQVIIPATQETFSGGVLHVRIEDTSYADREATLRGEAVLDGVRHRRGRHRGPGGLRPVRLAPQGRGRLPDGLALDVVHRGAALHPPLRSP